MPHKKILSTGLYLSILLFACKPAADSKEESAIVADAPGTPVTVTEVMQGDLEETVQLNAISAFLLKTPVNANATGYLQTVDFKLGDFVRKGQQLFSLKTKEAESLGNTLKILDSTLKFEGLIHIKSPGSGYVSQLSFQVGNYVQDGQQLATISDNKSFVFLLQLPFELRPYLPANKTLLLTLPDSSHLEGHILSTLPQVDPTSQTQQVQIGVNAKTAIPENLIARIKLVKSARKNVLYLPKGAVLSDDIQQNFWIMKMADSVTAVKVPVKKGMENAEKVEVAAPNLALGDKVVLSGNYGLADTARVNINP
jgi:multidrug efflux pump subunit AcrA (membrane-fusion protein)